MVNSKGVLYPALHKFYSALLSLERFKKGSDLFDNISYLDTFFSEYRNITFVLQKSLAGTNFELAYNDLRNQYLVNDTGKWFVKNRNSVTKHQPFDLEKRITLTIYTGLNVFSLPELSYTVESDTSFSTITSSLREDFLKLGQIEVFFSADFSFYERGKSDDLYDNFIQGIKQMKRFLHEMKKTINQNCKLTNDLEYKIRQFNFYRVPRDMLFVDDYVFNCRLKAFKKASRIALSVGPKGLRAQVTKLDQFRPDGDLFDKFEAMHLMIYKIQKDMLPTCIMVYADDTFEIESFGFSIKTTLYRKFAELAKRIESDNIVNILFVSEMCQYDFEDITNLDSDKKVKHAKTEVLAFFGINSHLAHKSHRFDLTKIDDFSYLSTIIYSSPHQFTLPMFLNPLALEFARVTAKSTRT